MPAQFSLLSSTVATTAHTTAANWLEKLRLEKLLTGVALTCALSLAMQGLAHSSEAPVVQKPIAQSGASSVLPDGNYLYGQAPKAGQLGATYLVFEVNKGKVNGAFYMPQSSFDCVHGTLQTQRLALTVVNSYEQASYPYAVALQAGGTSASSTGPNVAPIALEGFHPIKHLSANDRRILSTCKASYHGI
ncbi:hypothetical protein [Stenomitos frigidus]|uniref:Uncharacterized protein n=1 Tax=Stenomitos frigidus ULC18 TaxID=2107698 RepID=A0A2T1ES60_9CYAN|nr:hypothetical protein [Stenomitos frigidus]PSB35565.1 hypothetical protein C7B82_00795 [Stenomitos frigidus ULC18]